MSAPELPLQMHRRGYDPAPDLEEARATGRPVRVRTPFGGPASLVTRYEQVRELLADPSLMSNAWSSRDLPGLAEAEDTTAVEYFRVGNLLAYDPPEHTRLRRMLTPEFTVRRMRHLQPRIAEIVEDHLDAMERAGAPADLVSTFALPIPSLVICELLGVPYADRAEFQARTSGLLDLSQPVERRLALQTASREYMATLVERSRAAPGEDLLGMLVREHGDDVSSPELVGIASLLLVAGHETTSNMLGLGTLVLLEHPEQLAAVRYDPDAVGPAVEELLRWLSIVHSGSPRIAVTDVEVGGVTVQAGEAVLFSLPAANRDPEAVGSPDRLDVARGPAPHVAFGHGVHHCLGAPLARMEMQIAFPALLQRFPNLSTVTTHESATFRAYNAVYGLAELPVTW